MTKKKIEAPPEHQAFCGKRMMVEVNPGIFSKEELDFLEQYGFWLAALANGAIEPFTKEQTEFVEVCRGEREAVKMWEKAWWKLQKRREIDPDYRHAPQYQFIEHGTWAGNWGGRSYPKR